MKLGFCSLFLNEELSSIFGIDLLAATQTNSESGGDVSQIRAKSLKTRVIPGVVIVIYSFLFYRLFSGLGSLLRMFCSPCFTSAVSNKL